MNCTYYKTKVNSCTTCQNGKKALPPPYLDAVMYIPSQLGEEQGALQYFKSFFNTAGEKLGVGKYCCCFTWALVSLPLRTRFVLDVLYPWSTWQWGRTVQAVCVPSVRSSPLMVRAAHKLPLSLESGNVPRRGVCLPARDGYPNKCSVILQKHCLKTAAFNAEINYLPNLRHCHC